jgi:hypothetical protein
MNQQENKIVEVTNTPAVQPAKGLALAGFLCGLGSVVCCMGVPASVVGLALGHAAKKKGNRSGLRKAGTVFSIAGIVFHVLLMVFAATVMPDILDEVAPGLFGDGTVESVTNPPAHIPEEETTRELTAAEMLVYTANGDGTYAVSVQSGATLPQEVAIPSHHNGGTVTEIAPSGFMGQTCLRKISLPDTITAIGGTAFQGCRNLTKIDLPKGVVSIGPLAFSECRSLERVKIPEGVTEIPDSCFAGCVSLVEVQLPSTLTRVSDYAFLECKQLIGMVLPDSITYIGEGAFREITEPHFTLPASVAYIGHDALAIRELTAIAYPGTLEEWENKVVKEADWYRPVLEGDKLLYIICVDGTIDLRDK